MQAGCRSTTRKATPLSEFKFTGYYGAEGDEYPLRQRKHPACTNTEPHLRHGMAGVLPDRAASGQTCGGLPVIPEPRACRRCNGSGLVEVWQFGMREVRCTGEDDFGDCDGGMKVFFTRKTL